ncbi:MAG: Glycerol kinase [Arenicellales bacterium IbO2]|nr:MAG: Glycerol kinase [Arenicellales bacterium IbO2]
MKPQNLLSLDQGTTSSRAIVFARDGAVVAVAQREFAQHYPHEGWVEHEPEEIWRTTLESAREAVEKAGGAGCIAAVGIANQRETTVVWERESGRAVHNAIVWQDRRTAEKCAELAKKDGELPEKIAAKTGLLLDAYFSAPKIAWILDAVDGARRRAEAGELAFGTIDAFLLWRLCGRHSTDASNAGRTLLFDIHKQRWDEELLGAFGVPAAVLPEVRDCADDFGATAREWFGREIPVCGVAGDQQAALFGQACHAPGMGKCTFGSGAFLMATTAKPAKSRHRLLTTLASRLHGRAAYALEGSVFNAGTALQWLRQIGVFVENKEIKELLEKSLKKDEENAAGKNPSETVGTESICMVPAFTGLGAPHWRPHARAAIFGITRGAGRADLVRAAVEAVAFQTRDLLEAMRADGAEITALRVDGGMAVNDYLLQFLADISGVTVERPRVTETTALGAALLAGLQCGLYKSPEEAGAVWRKERGFSPNPAKKVREKVARKLAVWEDALARVKAKKGAPD